ncbi:MAG: S24 family peptidase [Candidatus Thalassarchaeaceae archaeon]|nr:S24 family peptidase [Candidatus Thalassarchaeaceae archaeon]
MSRAVARFLGFERVEQLTLLQVRVRGDSMWPTLKDGQFVNAIRDAEPLVGDIAVVKHPMKETILIKRIKRIEHDEMFIEGDNPDPLGSEDSHNFGPVSTSSIIAIICD